MRWHQVIGREAQVLLIAAFTAACGPVDEPHSVQHPKLETVKAAPPQEVWGADVAPGFLRPCATLSAGNGLVELACGDYQLVEFRKGPDEAPAGQEVPEPEGLGALMDILQARFGSLDEQRGSATIDSQFVETSAFESLDSKAGGAEGVAIVVPNKQGHFWGLACYRKDGAAANRSYCTDALATAARSGGLAHVEARPLKGFGDGKLVAPQGCERIPGRKIHCPEQGSLSWSVGNAEVLRQETVKDLRALAEKEKAKLATESRSCTLFGKDADCLVVRVTNPAATEQLNFVLLTGGEQERLIVCTTPRNIVDPLPQPCDQAIELTSSP